MLPDYLAKAVPNSMSKRAPWYANTAPTYAGMAQAYAKKNDKDNQIKSLEKAVQLDPNNQQLKRQLDQLKSGR